MWPPPSDSGWTRTICSRSSARPSASAMRSGERSPPCRRTSCASAATGRWSQLRSSVSTQPLIENPALLLVSGVDDVLPPRSGPRAGDRLTELVARPLVARCEPALAGLRQPLLGSFAARRSLLRTLRFPAGTGARLSLLIDTARDHGSDAVAEVPLGGRSPDDRPLRELGADAAELIVAVHRRFVTAHAIVDEHLVCNPGTISRESRSPPPSGPRLSSSSPMTIRAGHVRRRPQRPR